MNAAVSKLEALLARVQRNRSMPRPAAKVSPVAPSAAAPAAAKPVAQVAPAASKPLSPAARPVVSPVAPAAAKPVAPAAPAPAAVKPVAPAAPAPAAPARPASDAQPAAAKPAPPAIAEREPLSPEAMSELFAGFEDPAAPAPLAPVESAPADRKKAGASPLELAVESSVELPLGPEDEAEIPTAVAHVSTPPERRVEAEATAPVAEPERIVAPAPAASGPVATLASPFLASKPATFGELLDRTLHLKIR